MTNKTVKVKLLIHEVWNGSVYPVDSVVEVPHDLAQRWIDAKEAELVKSFVAVETPSTTAKVNK